MLLDPKRIGAFIVRSIGVLVLLGWPRVGSAHGTWSVIAARGTAPGQVMSPTALAVDAAGNLYVAEYGTERLQKRDAQGNWSVIATYGTAIGQVNPRFTAPPMASSPIALAVDTAGNLYVADQGVEGGRIQKRDAKGNWSLLDADHSGALAVDSAGNLYAAGPTEYRSVGRIHERDAQGSWSVIADLGMELGQVLHPSALAADAGGSLYIAEQSRATPPKGIDRIQKRDAQGNWSVMATNGGELGQVFWPRALAVDTAGNLYVGEFDYRIQKRDAQGNWSMIATDGSAVGQVDGPFGLAVDAAGNLYVADTNNSRVQKYTPQP